MCFDISERNSSCNRFNNKAAEDIQSINDLIRSKKKKKSHLDNRQISQVFSAVSCDGNDDATINQNDFVNTRDAGGKYRMAEEPDDPILLF